MAKKVSFNDIPDKNTDWGLDESNGFPYSGQSVQKYIKGALDGKAGIFYYDMTNNRYLVFGDAENRDIYLNDPTRTDLLIGTFDAPFNYTAEITMLTPSYNAIFLGSTGNYIDFTFDIKNKQGASTGENVNVTYTFIRNATKKVVTETRRYGEAVHFNVDDYLLEGSNTIIVGITGQTTLAATTVALTYNVVNLTLTDEMDISKVYDLSNGAQTMEVFFTVTGSGTKTVEWYLDGVQLDFVKSEDEVVDITSSRTKYITLANLSNGAHHLQIRAYTLINGEKFYTDTHYREVIIQNGSSSGNVIAVATDLPYTHGIVNESNPLVFYGAEQYLPYEVRFATLKTADVSIYLGDSLLATVTSTSGRESSYSIVSNKAGTMALKFVVGSVEREIPVAIENTSLNIEEIITALAFDFSARGKSNASTDKDSWSYGDYVGTFEGFNWNASSGWVNNALLINSGASFSVNIAPLALDATSTGKTLEFEFATRNVENDEAIVCDLIGSNGAGLLITASEARLVSAAGEVVSTKFKAGETNRIAFVVNRKTGTTYKGLAFIYVNGILSGAINFGSADNFISPSTLSFSGSEDAQVELRAMRFYDTALSSENVLNNYTLYRDTLNEMMDVYYRNDIYEDGTSSFSPYKAQHRLPVMIVTGDIPTLEGATSTSTQITVDVTYTNEQDPSKSFTMKDAAMRIQGTSSLAYPRKNFRIYTTKVDSTIVYDAEGKVIEDKLYSFKDGAQPVDCWCLKADYAESSGTHNTGIARIWNEAMYNAQIQYKNVLDEEVNGYVLRTEAQKAAITANYGYDVRTTIDGFPILLFYKKNASDTDLIFLGKYNFNNDKSTPSVFGFENIPNFDNSRMQCWETKDNGNPLGLFTDISGFDANWAEAYESRYPDTKTPNTADLKAFSLWVNGVSQSDFVNEKWSHLDVYKVAAYYVYLMRFGAVDQVVKNGFITSEDGEHFFYINYDNDTINGLINTGELRLDPEIDRQTIGTDGEYVYAGHSSVLWNLLEADSEFMDIVKVVDNALFSAGLRYDRVIEMFNDEQAAKWVERVYNQDAEYKYLLPYANAGTNNLFMLQGSRSSHRSWWLSKRFSLYDSLFVSGNYRDRNISFKCLNDTQAGQQFTITAGTTMNYGYGVNNGTREVGIALAKGESHTFTTTDTLNLGDVVKIFAAANIQGVDLSALASRLAVLDLSAAYDPTLGSKLKNLILGSTTTTNTELGAISGIGMLEGLQLLNIEGYKGLTEIDLTKQKDFRKLYAKGSNISSVDFSKGAPVDHLELPASMLALNLQQLPYLTTDNLVLEDKSNVTSVKINGCPLLSNDFDFAYDWIMGMSESNVFEMDSIAWDNVATSKLIEIGQVMQTNANIKLLGVAKVASITLDQVNTLRALFGDDVFDEGADFRIKAPESIFLSGPTSIREGESAQFLAVVFSDNKGTVKYSIVSGSRDGVSIDENTGLLTSTENGLADSTLVIRAVHTSTTGATIFVDSTLKILMLTYPTSLSISGDSAVEDGETYTLTVSPTSYTGTPSFVWTLTGAAVDDGLILIKEQSASQCVIQLLSRSDTAKSATLKCTAYKNDGTTVAASVTKSLTVAAYTYPTAVTLSGATSVKDGNVYTLTYTPTTFDGPITNVSWALSGDVATYVSLGERDKNQCVLNVSGVVLGAATGTLAVIVTLGNGTELTASMDVLVLDPTVLMTSVTNPNAMAVMYAAGLAANESYMTYDEAAAVTDSQLQSGTSYSTSIFYTHRTYAAQITTFDEFEYFTGLTSVPAYCFPYCTAMESIKLPPQITEISYNAFYRNSSSYAKKLTSITIPEGVTTIGNYAFSYVKLASVVIPSTVTTIGGSAFSRCNELAAIAGCSGVMSVSYDAFENIPSNTTIAQTATFGLFKQTTGFYITANLYSGNISSLLYGVKTFKLPAGAYFEDMTASKDLLLAYTGGIEDLTDKLKIGYLTLAITSNMTEAEFSIAYTATDGTSKTVTKGVGSHILDIKLNTSVTITPITEYDGYQCVAKTQTISAAITTVAMDYVENVYIYIKHTNGTLYTTDDWSAGLSAGTLSNDNADGVCVMRELSGGFVIAKENAANVSVKFGGYNKTIAGIVTTSTTATALLDFDGYGNTTKIIEQLAGYTDSYGTVGAPAAEACAAYTFPNGKMGYMPALGEWQLAFNNKTEVDSAMSLIGGTAIEEAYYWSSTLKSVYSGWAFRWIYGHLSETQKGSSNRVRAFASFGRLTINSTLTTSFDVSYTTNQGKSATRTVGVGGTLFNVKMGTTMTITPRPIGNITAEAQTITWDDTVKEVSFAFAKDAGVYIQHTNGSLHTEAEWTAAGYTNDVANGVAILSATAPALVIAKADVSSSGVRWGGNNKLITGIVTTTSSSTGVLDFDGEGNTTKIITQLAGYTDNYNSVGAPAAEACAAYVFPNGKTGYLGALGEWQAVYNNKAAVDSAMSLIGGAAIQLTYYWSSTQQSAGYVWHLYFGSGSMSNGSKGYNCNVRAFTSL